MDRHDSSGTSAEEVAQAHVLDLQHSHEYGVQLLAYWFDADAEVTFCIANARVADDLVDLHRASHGGVPNEIIPVSEDNVLRFLGKIEDPADHTEATSPFRTILFTDLEGSTRLLHELGEPGFLALLAEHDLIIRRALVASQGREVKHTGDGIMASFDDVEQALRCAQSIQDGFDARRTGDPQVEMRVRIGMAAGEPVDRDNDLFGAAVNLASRLCDAADAGHILVSDVVRDRGVKCGFAFGEAATRELKGIAGPTTVFELRRATGG